jgi:hypothetical protein
LTFLATQWSRHDGLDMSAEEARAKLDAARRMRMLGEIEMCREFAQAAHYLANEAGDGETAYHAYACLGRMHLWRAEYDQAYVQYREALRVAEGFELKRWLSPAHHDCFISAHEAGYRPEGDAHADPCLDGWRLPGSRTWAFVHDMFRALVRGNPTRHARAHAAGVLRQSAISASWCIRQPPPGSPWYEVYQPKFERVAVYATMSHACGMMVRDGGLEDKHLVRALNLFEMAADDLGSDEGHALNLIDAAQGAHAGGKHSLALEQLALASVIANRRGEDRVGEEVEKLRQAWGAQRGT